MEKKDVPYIVFEGTMARMERVTLRLWMALILTIFLLVATNVAWFQYESQFEDVTTITQDLDSGDGGSAIINDGVHINGESKTNGN